jgi:peroxiredoxin
MLKRLEYKKLWLSLLLVTFLAAAIGVLMQTGAAAEKVGPQIGNKTPDFTLGSLTSKNVELYQVVKENKVTLINFWGKWCPYCVQEIPELVKFYKQYHQRQVEILAVNVGDDPKDVPLFAKENQMVFPVLIDKSNAVSTLYQVSGFPTTFIINRQGKIKDMIVGGTNQETLAAKVDAVLREK